jgi:hypothetical protein
MPVVFILSYNGSLVTITVVSLTAAKFKPLTFIHFFSIIFKHSVRTSQETLCVSVAKIGILMLFRQTNAITVKTIRNTYIHCVGRMQGFGMLKHVVHTGLKRVNWVPG